MPLLWAAANGDVAIAKLLVATEKGEVEAKDNKHGRTPLWQAAENGHGAVELLRSHSAQSL